MEAWTVSADHARNPENFRTWDVDADSAEEALEQALSLSRDGSKRTFTVFGVWYKDEAVSVAVVEGRHEDALTGDADSFNESEYMHESWYLFVEAETAQEAERKAVGETDPGMWREHSNQLGDWCPWSGTSVIPGDEVCPAMCPSSAVDYDPDEDDEEDEES